MSKSKISGVKFNGIKFQGVKLAGQDLTVTSISGTPQRPTTFTLTDLSNTKLNGMDLSNVLLNIGENPEEELILLNYIPGADFSGTDLSNTIFSQYEKFPLPMDEKTERDEHRQKFGIVLTGTNFSNSNCLIYLIC